MSNEPSPATASPLRAAARRLLPPAAFGAAVTGALVAFAGPGRFLEALARFPAGTILAATLLTLANYLLRFAKWHYYLRLLSIGCPAGLSFRVFLAGMSMSITPGKFGEAAKSLLLKSERGIPISVSAPVVLAERLTDLLAVVALTLLGLAAHPEALRYAAAGLLAALAASAALATGLLPRLLARALPRHAGRVETLFRGARVLLSPAPLLLMTALSILSWSMECLGFLLVAEAVAGPLPLSEATYIYAVSTLAGALSMLPGGLAATEGGLALLLVRRGATIADAGAATFAIRALTLWLGVALGAACLFATFDVRRALEALAPAPRAAEDGAA